MKTGILIAVSIAADITSRVLADQMSKGLGQPSPRAPHAPCRV